MNIVAIGDVHGCITKLQEKVQPLIGSQSEVVFLGDLIDRSPEENGDLRVLQLIHFMEQNPQAFGLKSVTVLTGNHEQAFLQAYDGDDSELWSINGGNPELLYKHVHSLTGCVLVLRTTSLVNTYLCTLVCALTCLWRSKPNEI